MYHNKLIAKTKTLPRKNNKNSKNKELASKKNKKPIGFGGWFIIPLINIILYGFFSLVTVFIYSIYGIEYQFEIILLLTSLIGVAFTYYLCTLMFSRSKNFPKIFIIWLWTSLGLSLIDSLITRDYALIFGELIFNIIWTRYALESERVKNTFTK